MPHPGYMIVAGGWSLYGSRVWNRVSNKGRKDRRRERRMARRLGQRMDAAMKVGGVAAFCAVALDAMHADPWERAGFALKGPQ